MTLAEKTKRRDWASRPHVSDPLDGRALIRRGIDRLKEGDREGALEDFRQATTASPGLALAWNNSGLIRQLLGRFTEARTDFDRAVAMQSENPEFLVNRARLSIALGDPTEALADLDAALACAPCPYAGVILHERALLRQKLGDLSGALQDWDGAVAADADSLASLFGRGAARKELGDLEGAFADFKRVLELATCHNHLG